MRREWTITLVVLPLLVAGWWLFPNIRDDDKGYTALGTLLSAFAFLGLLLTLMVQGRSMQKVEEQLDLQRDSNRVARSGALITAIATVVEHLDGDLRRVDERLKSHETQTLTALAERIESLEHLIANAEIDNDMRNAGLATFFKAVVSTFAGTADERQALLDEHAHLSQMRLTLLQEMLIVMADVAAGYVDDPTKHAQTVSRMQSQLRTIYGVEI